MKSLAAFSETKIMSWSFGGPIVIEEKEFGGYADYFIIDNWCLVGQIRIDAEGNKKSNIDENVTFDLDLYKILKSYLKKSSLGPHVKQITRHELASYLH